MRRHCKQAENPDLAPITVAVKIEVSMREPFNC
jgi:hypothetical protein